MKYVIIWFLGFVFIAVGCNTTDVGDPAKTAIKPGLYEMQAKRTEVGGEQVSASAVGGYFQKSLRFFEGDSLNVQVKSDIPDENGLAKARYSVSRQQLLFSIKKSTTTYYRPGSTITFDSFQKVDSDYVQTFNAESGSYTFHGPGLVLQSRQPDTSDLDQDGNATEIVHTTEYYYHFAVRYD